MDSLNHPKSKDAQPDSVCPRLMFWDLSEFCGNTCDLHFKLYAHVYAIKLLINKVNLEDSMGF